MNDVIAIIPARSGSKSVSDKNVKMLSGHPLMAYSIAAAKLSKSINRVIVSTNSEDYANIARSYGAEAPFIRPEEHSTDTATDRGWVIHAMEWLKKNEDNVPDYWVHLRPTTPLRDFKIIDKAVDLMKSNSNFTSLRSAHKSPESPFKWFLKKEDYFKGILNDNDHYSPKEGFETVYIPNGYVDILKPSYVMNNPEIYGNSMFGFVSPMVSEVDSIDEFDYIQYQMSREKSDLESYLNSI